MEAPLLDSARHVYLSTCDAHNVMPLPLLIADPSRGDEEGCVNLDSYQVVQQTALMTHVYCFSTIFLGGFGIYDGVV